jgi:uncharacterized protein YebE (UPF0316 family)
METLLSNVWLGMILIFTVRVLSITLSTIRYLTMGRANRFFVSGIAFFEALTFAVTFGVVARDLTNLWFLFAYCAGFAMGTWVGILIEDWMAQGYQSINIISMSKSLLLVQAVREAGFGATRTSGEGTSGTVGVIYVVARRRNVPQVVEIVTSIDPKAFITVGETRSVRRGFLGYGRS